MRRRSSGVLAAVDEASAPRARGSACSRRAARARARGRARRPSARPRCRCARARRRGGASSGGLAADEREQLGARAAALPEAAHRPGAAPAELVELAAVCLPSRISYHRDNYYREMTKGGERTMCGGHHHHRGFRIVGRRGLPEPGAAGRAADRPTAQHLERELEERPGAARAARRRGGLDAPPTTAAPRASDPRPRQRPAGSTARRTRSRLAASRTAARARAIDARIIEAQSSRAAKRGTTCRRAGGRARPASSSSEIARDRPADRRVVGLRPPAVEHREVEARR